MSPPEMRNGAPPQGPATAEIAATANRKLDPVQANPIPRVAARFYGPSGRRGLGVLLVAQCPHCAGAHLHRGAGGVRRAGCGAGEYMLVAVPGVTRGRRAAA